MAGNLLEALKAATRPGELPDGTPYRSLRVGDTAALATAWGISGREVEIAALDHGIVPERYARNLRAFSLEEQIQLLRSRVAVVGLGGLGGSVTEILARVGVGRLILIDGDRFEESNLNRQFLSTEPRLASSKAEAAAARVGEINTGIETVSHAEFLSLENADTLLAGSAVIVDCLDNIHTRFVLEDAARRIGAPMVSAAAAGGSGHVTTIFPEDPGLELIFGPRDTVPPKGSEKALGCLPIAVPLLATLEASEAVKIILNRGRLLRDSLLSVDVFDNAIDILRLR